MSQGERIQAITDILDKNGFVTVKFLMDELHYSSATINRDLNVMKNQGTVKRQFGGVELVEEKTVPLHFRYSKMRTIKNKIGETAAQYIKNGDTLFIDCSTTAQYIGKYITNRQDLTVITNNLSLASFLSEHNITSICLGGRIVEPPFMAYSEETVEAVRKYGADKLFFSSCAITPDGKIGCGENETHTLMIRAMMENAQQRFLLLDHEKITPRCRKYLGNVNEIDMVITDFTFPEDTKRGCPHTTFMDINDKTSSL